MDVSNHFASGIEPAHLLDLLRRAAKSGKHLFFLDNGFNAAPTKMSYAELLKDAQQRAAALRRTIIQKNGQIVLTYFDSHLENIIWFWSIVAAGGVGAIMSPLSNEPRAAAGQLQNIETLFGNTPLITNAKFAKMFATQGLHVKTSVDIEHEMAQAGAHFDAIEKLSQPDDVATMLFTSGSTGNAKAVQYSHAQLITSARVKVEYLGSYQKTFMSWTSFDHSANFCEVHLQSMYACTDQIHIPASELVTEPYRFYKLLSDFRVGYTFTPNFLLAAATKSFRGEAAVLDTKSWDLSNLRTIMCAGEANRTETLTAADQILRDLGAPLHSIRAAYGLSETCSACFYCMESPQYDIEYGSKFASAGEHLPGVLEMKLLADNGSESYEGVLYLRGTLVFKGYFNNDLATKQCLSDDGWFNTGDIARVDKNGKLHLLGRQKEVLILHGNNYSSFELEYSIEMSNIPGLTTSYTAVFSTWDEKKQSEAVVVLFNPTEEAIGPQQLRKTLRAIDRVVFAFASEKALHIIPLPKSLLPKSSIGKLSRAQLRKAYEAGAFCEYLADELLSPSHSIPFSGEATPSEILDVTTSSPAPRRASTPPLHRDIAAAFAPVVGITIDRLLHDHNDALPSTGINSLGFIKVKRNLEKAFNMNREIPMRTLVRCTSMSELALELSRLGITSGKNDRDVLHM